MKNVMNESLPADFMEWAYKYSRALPGKHFKAKLKRAIAKQKKKKAKK